MGKDSPVRDDWLIKRSLQERIRRSAGIMSPAKRFTMSPGTISRIRISTCSPPRKTVAVARTSSFSFSAALWERYSWVKERPTLRKIMKSTSRAWIFSPKKSEKTQMTIRTRMSGSQNFWRICHNTVLFFFLAGSL